VLRKLCKILFVSLFVCLYSAAWGQGVGTINGIVTDPSGASVPNAKITVTEAGTGLVRTVTTADNGLYTFTSLRPTTYALAVEATGFQQINQSGVLLQANQSLTINLKLNLGSTSQVVDVTTDVQRVDTSSSTVSNVIDSARITELPLNGRNAAQLSTLVPGSVIAPAEDADEGITKTFPVAIAVSTNGGRANEVSYFLDGVPNIDFMSNINLPFPMPDALQEFSVQTSNYSAEFGETAGAVVNIVTRSGTNEFHGNVFGYIRNAYFNAKNRFATVVDPLHREQFGGNVGGPIKKDKLFFFFGYQGTHYNDVMNGLSATVPTAANLRGDFSNQTPNSIYVPSTGQHSPNNFVDPATFDPAALAVLKLLPTAPAGNTSGIINYSKPVIQRLNEYTTKEDWAINSKDRLSARYFYDKFSAPAVLVPGNLFTYTDFTDFLSQNVGIEETHIFTSNLLNDFRFGFEHESDMRGPPSNSPTLAQFGVKIPQGSVAAIEQIAVTGFWTPAIGSFPQGEFPRRGISFGDSIRWQVGRHSFVFGGSYEHDNLYEFTATNQNGIFTFTGSAPATVGKPTYSTGNALADFLTGKPLNFTQASGYVQDNRYNLPAAFAQDSFKVSPRVTINYGVRWEPALPWHDIYHEAAAFSPANYASGATSIVYPNAPPGEIFAGDPGVYEDGRPSNWYNFAPRVGIAWDVFGDGKTSLRGGVGEFFDSRTPGFANNRMAQSTPFTLAVTLTQPAGGFSNPYLGQNNPFPSALPPPKNLTFPTPVLVYAYNQNDHRLNSNTLNGNITLEQQMPGNILMRVAGVFTRGAHLNATEEINPSVFGAAGTTTQARRVNYGKYFAQIYENTSSAGSRYNSLQLTVQKRMSRGFTVSGNYTWSKSIDDVPNGTDSVSIDVGSTYALPPNMPNFRALDTGPSEFDFEHHLSVSFVWVLPTLKGSNPYVRGAFGGWSINGITTLQSGGPLTIVSGVDNSQTNILFDRAVTTGSPVYATSRACSPNCISYLNKAAFAVNPPGTFGTVGRGQFRGPGIDNSDLAVTRDFPLPEHITFQFRAEYFNFANHPNLGNPNCTATTLSCPNTSFSANGFGTITAAADPRIAQFAVKVLF
jgi:hypothetical protein